MRLPSAGLLQGKNIDLKEMVDVSVGWTGINHQETVAFRRRVGGARVSLGEMQFHPYLRMLAKIAHAYAVATAGISAFKHELVPLILGKSNRFLHFIGGAPGATVVQPRLHDFRLGRISVNGKPYYVVRVDLFAHLPVPRFLIVVGEHLREPLWLDQEHAA